MKRLFLGAFLAVIALTASADTYKGYEMPPFEVLASRQGYEIRDYAPHVLATVHQKGSVSQSASAGFRALAGYIFGGNASGEKIAMTVPVQQVAEGSGYTISFMMPAKYEIGDLPPAKSSDITFSRTNPERLAVRAFSGYAGAATLRRKAAELRDLLARDGLQVVGGPRFAYYDDPFTLPWRRRNEVAFVLAE
ncbi:MAG: heme-binding protein [Pseudomonadota bacterium]